MQIGKSPSENDKKGYDNITRIPTNAGVGGLWMPTLVVSLFATSHPKAYWPRGTQVPSQYWSWPTIVVVWLGSSVQVVIRSFLAYFLVPAHLKSKSLRSHRYIHST